MNLKMKAKMMPFNYRDRSCIRTVEFEYNDNYKNIFDLYLDNSCTEKGLLGNKSVDDSMSEFALGKCAMVQNGNWAWSQN